MSFEIESVKACIAGPEIGAESRRDQSAAIRSFSSKARAEVVLLPSPRIFILFYPFPTMAEVDTQKMQLDGQQLYTCLSCTIAFLSAEEQRESTFCQSKCRRGADHTQGLHYRSDHHRYNMKRRVANLPPVSAALFNQKVLERRQETEVMLSPKGQTCDVCK